MINQHTICIQEHMKHLIVATVILTNILVVFSFAACRGGVEQKSRLDGKREGQPLFSSMNDTILWMSDQSPFFPKKGWSFENEELRLSPGRVGGSLITRKRYSDFELSLEFKMTKMGNSGVKYFLNRMTDKSNNRDAWIGFEYQIIDDFSADDIKGYEGAKGSTGALYLIYPPDPDKKKLHAPGEWNTMRVIVDGTHVEHWLNGEKVVSADIDSDDFRHRVAETKFANYADYGKLREGHILLQDHGDEIAYRNIFLLDNRHAYEKIKRE
jgi:hypothetical protein